MSTKPTTKHTTKSCHYTNLGVSMQPSCADSEGYIEYRDHFERLPREQWTAAEEWLHYQEERIENWRNGND